MHAPGATWERSKGDLGLGLCLLANINAFKIWKSLYTDQQLRATFAGPYADKATKLAEAQANAAAPQPGQQATDAQIKSFQTGMRGFLTAVSFGIGRIWQVNPIHDNSNQTQRDPIFGSLLTGILVSIGAPVSRSPADSKPTILLRIVSRDCPATSMTKESALACCSGISDSTARSRSSSK